MDMIKKYTADAFSAITALGTAYFYFLLILLLLVINIRRLVIHLVIGLAICYTAVFIFRLFYFKERPVKEKYTNLITKISASSFPSLHTLSFTFLAIVFCSYFKNIYLSILLYIIAFLVGISRVYLKKHYFIDVLFGWILGVLAGIIYYLILG